MIEKTKNIDRYQKRFGRIAIEKKYITQAQLIEGLKIQVQEELENNNHMLIGEILMDLDLMNANQIEDVVKTIFKR